MIVKVLVPAAQAPQQLHPGNMELLESIFRFITLEII
jgi:hypothetical protein